MPNNEADKQLLEDRLLCAGCYSAGGFQLKKYKGTKEIEYMVDALPGLTYIQSQMINFIFSNKLTTGLTEYEDTFKKFIYRKNIKGITNYQNIQMAISSAIVFGQGGIRKYENNLYFMPYNTYRALTYTDDGIERIVGYVARKDGKEISRRAIKFNEWNVSSVEEFIQNLDKIGLIFLDHTNFFNMRNKLEYINGKSPLLSDKLCLDLLLRGYERLNYDIVYDGPGRIILRLQDGYYSGDKNEVGTSEAVTNTVSNKKDLVKRAKDEAKKIAEGIRNSSSDDVIVLSNNFKENIEKLGRITKSTELLDWLKNEGTIVARALGMTPSLVEMSDSLTDRGTEKLLDSGMKNNITPLREHYALQFSQFLSDMINEEFGTKIEKIYFSEYKKTETESKTEKLKEYANILYKLRVGSKDSENIPEEYKALESDITELISRAIHKDDGTLEEI